MTWERSLSVTAASGWLHALVRHHGFCRTLFVLTTALVPDAQGVWVSRRLLRVPSDTATVRRRMMCPTPKTRRTHPAETVTAAIILFANIRSMPNDPSSATRPTRAFACNLDAMAGFAAAHG